MMFRCVSAAVLLALTSPAFAQQPLQDRWPTPGQQMQSAPAAPSAQPKAAVAKPAKPPAAPASKHAEPLRAVICGAGVFGKDTSHIKLAEMFEAQNIAYSEVDGPQGSKLMASVIYPKDPTKRLEVLWQNDATRSDLAVISINGKSTWIAPKGLKLGMPLAALEKLNGKPFKLAGFDWDDGGSVRDWMGGALAVLPGGCVVGMKLGIDQKTSAEVRGQVAGDKDFLSSDPLVRAAKPMIEEITIGYPQSQ